MFNYFRKKRFVRLVKDAYAHPQGGAHNEIKKHAEAYVGIRPGNDLRQSGKYIHRIYQAVRKIASRATGNADLGACPVGFEDVLIHCYKTDANTSSVYLFGFSDNRTIFDLYKKHIKPGSVVIDVGANIGMHSLVMAKLTGPDGQVYSYEPSPSVYQRLADNVALNHAGNVVLRQTALGSETGSIGFVDCADQANIGISHVDENSDYKVPVTTMDLDLAEVANVSLIKLDVEGHELEALRGAQQLLAREKPVIVIECNTDAYSVKELIEVIPYKVDMYRVPDTLNDSIQPLSVNDEYSGQFNALLIPLSWSLDISERLTL